MSDSITDRCLNCSCSFSTGCAVERGDKPKSSRYEYFKSIDGPAKRRANARRQKEKKYWLNYDRRQYFKDRYAAKKSRLRSVSVPPTEGIT